MRLAANACVCLFLCARVCSPSVVGQTPNLKSEWVINRAKMGFQSVTQREASDRASASDDTRLRCVQLSLVHFFCVSLSFLERTTRGYKRF